MKTKEKLMLVMITVVVFLLLFAGYVFSQPTETDKPLRPGLGLTPEQREKIRSTALEGRKDEIRLSSDLKIAHLELRELMQQENLDKAKINKKLDEIGALRTKLQKAKFERKMALREVLTKEQLQTFRERRLHRASGKRIIEKRIRLKDGKLQRLQRQRIGPLSEEMNPPLPQEEEVELSIAPEEPPLEPEISFLEEELAPLFEGFEPLPPEEEPQPVIEEELQFEE